MTFWFIGAILVLAAVSLSAAFEQIDRDVDREFQFQLERCIALLHIEKSREEAIEWYLFWGNISTMLYNTGKEIWEKQNASADLWIYTKTVMHYQEITRDLGDSVLEDKDE